MNNWQAMPLLLSVKDLTAVLGVCLTRSYALLTQEDFPKGKICRTYKIYRDELRRWLEMGAPK